MLQMGFNNPSVFWLALVVPILDGAGLALNPKAQLAVFSFLGVPASVSVVREFGC